MSADVVAREPCSLTEGAQTQAQQDIFSNYIDDWGRGLLHWSSYLLLVGGDAGQRAMELFWMHAFEIKITLAGHWGLY